MYKYLALCISLLHIGIQSMEKDSSKLNEQKNNSVFLVPSRYQNIIDEYAKCENTTASFLKPMIMQDTVFFVPSRYKGFITEGVRNAALLASINTWLLKNHKPTRQLATEAFTISIEKEIESN